MKRLRIMVNTNGPQSTSGYGSQAHDLLPRIKKAGYEVASLSFYGNEGNRVMWKCHQPCCDGKWPEIEMYPKIGDAWGGDAIIPHSQHFKADVVFTLQDIWVLDPNMLRAIPRWIPILPVDHSPVPPAIIERIKSAYRIVTYAQFGKDELRKQGLYSTYIQHTVDTQIFKPADKAGTKKMLGVSPDTYLFGMVGANKDNPSRKSFQETIDAFKMFHDKHPNSAIYFHTILQQQGGFDIATYTKYLGLEASVFSLPVYDQMFKVDRRGMASVYNAFDCLVTPSTNGAFEVPLIEAQACGVVAITNNFTAMPELLTPETGWACDVAFKRFSPLQAYVGIPSVKSLYECMEKSFVADRVKMGKAARKHAVENYDTDRIFESKWLPFLTQLEDEIYGKEEVKKLAGK